VYQLSGCPEACLDMDLVVACATIGRYSRAFSVDDSERQQAELGVQWSISGAEQEADGAAQWP